MITEKEAQSLSPNALAFYGDSVYEVLVRERAVTAHHTNAGRLHDMAVERVRASYQSEAVNVIEPMLTEKEADILRRGRNAGGIPFRKARSPRNIAARRLSKRCSDFLHSRGKKSVSKHCSARYVRHCR